MIGARHFLTTASTCFNPTQKVATRWTHFNLQMSSCMLSQIATYTLALLVAESKWIGTMHLNSHWKLICQLNLYVMPPRVALQTGGETRHFCRMPVIWFHTNGDTHDVYKKLSGKNFLAFNSGVIGFYLIATLSWCLIINRGKSSESTSEWILTKFYVNPEQFNPIITG